MKLLSGIIFGVVGAIGVIVTPMSPLLVLLYPIVFAALMLPIPLVVGIDRNEDSEDTEDSER